MRMIASYYGNVYPLSYLRNLSCLARDGVSLAGIREGLQAIHMEVNSYRMSLDKLLDCELPIILHWKQNHFVVLYKITQKNSCRYYWIADPAFAKYKLSESEFCKEWLCDKDGIALLAKPTKEFFLIDPPRETLSIKSFLIKYLTPFRREMLQLCLGLLAGVVVSLITPFLTQAMVDKGIGDRNVNTVIIIVIAQLCLFIGNYSISLIRNWVTLFMGTRININIVSDFLEKIMKLPMKFFETKSTGDFQQRIADHSRLQTFATSETISTMFSLISYIVFFVIIGFYSISILLIYMLFTTVSMLWMLYFMRRRKSVDYKLFHIRSESHNSIMEMINGMTEIKLNNFQQYKTKEWRGIQEKQYEASMDSLKIDQWQLAGYTLFNQIKNIVVTFVVALSVIKGDITLGIMMSISYIIGQMDGPLGNFISFVRSLQDSKISLERAGEVHLLNDEDNRPDGEAISEKAEDISLQNLYFRYGPSTDRMILKDISVVFPQGKTTAIVGESGSGKTTIMKLLLKCYQQTGGDIYVGNSRIDNIAADIWRDKCGIVMQDNYLFSETVLRNIIMGDESMNVERLAEAIRVANLEEFIKSKPMGLYTKIGSSGVGISGGERQRIMIARAVYKDPQYLFLDEATSFLDAENESIIVGNLESFFKGKSVIIIAHRLSTVRSSDQIVVLKDGEIVEMGAHDELIKLHRIYYSLVHNQLELSK